MDSWRTSRGAERGRTLGGTKREPRAGAERWAPSRILGAYSGLADATRRRSSTLARPFLGAWTRGASAGGAVLGIFRVERKNIKVKYAKRVRAQGVLGQCFRENRVLRLARGNPVGEVGQITPKMRCPHPPPVPRAGPSVPFPIEVPFPVGRRRE